MSITEGLQKKLLEYQKNEITEYHIYKKIAKTIKVSENQQIVEKIAADEYRHYNDWKKYTKQDV